MVRPLSILMAALIPAIAAADEPIKELLKKAPNQANVLLVADIARIFTSPVAVLGNWEKERAKEYETAAAGISPEIRRLVVASEIDVTTLEMNWQVALAESRGPVKLAKLANAQPGSEDEIEGLPTMVSSQNAFFVALGDKQVGMMAPANRQSLARWLRVVNKGTETKYSPYLQQAVDRVNQDGEVVIALDMADVLELKGLHRRLSKSPAVIEQKADVDALAKWLVGMKGLTFIVKFSKDIAAEMRLDFSAPAKDFAPLAKPIVQEALDQIGLPVAHFEKWRTHATGNTIIISGAFDMRGLRQVSSFLLTTAPSLNPSSAADTPESNSPAEISRRYFKTVTKLIDDLHAEKGKSFSKLAYLFTQYAKKIDELPIVDVDPELVQYAGDVASTFRAVSNMTRTEGSRQKSLDLTRQDKFVATPGTTYYGYGVNGYGRPWGYGYQGTNVERYNNYQQVTLMQANSAANEAAVRNDVWRQIDDLTAATRRKMVAKYKIEF